MIVSVQKWLIYKKIRKNILFSKIIYFIYIKKKYHENYRCHDFLLTVSTVYTKKEQKGNL